MAKDVSVHVHLCPHEVVPHGIGRVLNGAVGSKIEVLEAVDVEVSLQLYSAKAAMISEGSDGVCQPLFPNKISK